MLFQYDINKEISVVDISWMKKYSFFSDLITGLLPEGVIDIDYFERDSFKEPVYAEDVMAYLREQENRYVVPRNYLEGTYEWSSLADNECYFLVNL